MKINCIYLILLALVPFLNCGKGNNETNIKEKGKNKLTELPDSLSSLKSYSISSESKTVIKLPNELKEISGLASTPEGRLFVHNDESAIIYELNPTDGSIIKKFAAGRPALKDDFEDIEFAEGTFYLVNSKGDIIEFRESGNGEYSEYKKYNTLLSSSYDVEGLCYDIETNSLLLACKGFSGSQATNDKSVFSFSLKEKKLTKVPRFTIKSEQAGKRFAPSGIRRNPVTGTFYLISAAGNSIIEVSKNGELIDRQELSPNNHEQPEGITFMPDNSMLIANEGKSSSGYIVRYPYAK